MAEEKVRAAQVRKDQGAQLQAAARASFRRRRTLI